MSDTIIDPPIHKVKIYENPVIGDKVIFLKTSEETNGAYTLMEIELAPGGGNTLHLHRDFNETFRAIEGSLDVQVGKVRKTLQPGETWTVPINTPHCFQNPTGQIVKFQVELRPGHTGFENCIKIAYGLAKDGLTNQKSIPKHFSHLALVVTMGGSLPAGIFSLLMPLFRWKAKQARKKGVEKALFDKYC